MPTKVFISYRRDDIAGHAGCVYDRLEREFGRDRVFMDVDGIPLGLNFAKVLGEEVAKCDVLLAIIGPKWIDVCDENGTRPLDNPDDFVRIEIAAALNRDIPVIPILLEGRHLPKADQLPDELKELSLRNGLDVRNASFHNDMDKLIRALKGQSGRSTAAPAPVPAGAITVEFGVPWRSERRYFVPGNGSNEWFKDLEHGPQMVVVPAGEFRMGSSPSEIEAQKKQYSSDWFHGDDPHQLSSDWFDSEGPQRTITIRSPFAVGRFPVTFAEWDACVADGGCGGYRPDDYGWGRGNRPVTDVSWNDAKQYISWLNAKTAKTYRLPSEAEREYLTRAGTTTPFWWGSSISTVQANYNSTFAYGDSVVDDLPDRDRPLRVDWFGPNQWGLYQVHGNVSEWCEDVWHDNYLGAPTDGSAWHENGDASRRICRGGSFYDPAQKLRATYRDRHVSGFRYHDLGFRLVRMV